MTPAPARTGDVTGTRDKDYNLIWYVEACLRTPRAWSSTSRDAERDKDNEVVELFRKAQSEPQGRRAGQAVAALPAQRPDRRRAQANREPGTARRTAHAPAVTAATCRRRPGANAASPSAGPSPSRRRDGPRWRCRRRSPPGGRPPGPARRRRRPGWGGGGENAKVSR